MVAMQVVSVGLERAMAGDGERERTAGVTAGVRWLIKYRSSSVPTALLDGCGSHEGQ